MHMVLPGAQQHEVHITPLIDVLKHKNVRQSTAARDYNKAIVYNHLEHCASDFMLIGLTPLPRLIKPYRNKV